MHQPIRNRMHIHNQTHNQDITKPNAHPFQQGLNHNSTKAFKSIPQLFNIVTVRLNWYNNMLTVQIKWYNNMLIVQMKWYNNMNEINNSIRRTECLRQVHPHVFANELNTLFRCFQLQEQSSHVVIPGKNSKCKEF